MTPAEQIAKAREALDRIFERKSIQIDRRILDEETFQIQHPGVEYRTARAPRASAVPSPLVAAVRAATILGRRPSDAAIEAWNHVIDLAGDDESLIDRASEHVHYMTNALDRAERKIAEKIDRETRTQAQRAELDRQRRARRTSKNRERHLRRLGREPGPPGRPIPPPWLFDGPTTVVCEGRVGPKRKWLIAVPRGIFDAVAGTALEALDDPELWSPSSATPETVALLLEAHARGSVNPDWIAEPPRMVVPCLGYYYVGLKAYRCPFSAAKALRRAQGAAARGSHSGE